MDRKKKALLSQLQISGAGLIILVITAAYGQYGLALFGALIIVFGIARFFLLRKLLGNDPEPDDGTTLDDFLPEKKEGQHFWDSPDD